MNPGILKLAILSACAAVGFGSAALLGHWHGDSARNRLGAAATPAAATTPPAVADSCLQSGDGFLKARLDGALEMQLDWVNDGTRCEGGARPDGNGIRVSFSHGLTASSTDGQPRRLLVVFGIAGLSESSTGRALPANLTIVEEGGQRIFGTLGDDKCVVDELQQQLIPPWRADSRLYRVTGRGFCLQPARAVGGDAHVLMSTFDFAGPVRYESDAAAPPASQEHP